MKIISNSRALALVLSALVASGCGRGPAGPSATPNANTAERAGGAALVVRAGDSPAPPDSREPELRVTAGGRLVMSWVQKVGEKRYALRFAAREGGGAWSEPRTVAEGENWFVNWADFPSVVELSDGSLAAHWLVKSGPGTYAYDVNIARSSDGGKSWGRPLVPHTDGTQTEHGFVSMMSLAGGRLGAAWVDGRATKDVKEGHDENVPLPVSMALRYAAVAADGKLSDEAVLDERICECCQTSAALTSEGPIVAYRDRSDAEVRDIYVVRQQAGRWGAPRPVHADNWQINGCPVNGPSVAADGRRAAVAWFTAAGDDPRVQVAFSGDAGATFGGPVRVDDGDAMGRVDVVLLPDGSAVVCWLSGTAEKGAVKARRVRADGAVDAVAVVAESDISRSSGFPQLARVGDELHFAWTEFGKPSRVRAATANVAAFK